MWKVFIYYQNKTGYFSSNQLHHLKSKSSILSPLLQSTSPPLHNDLIFTISSSHLPAEVGDHPDGGGEDDEVDPQGCHGEPVEDGSFCFSYYEYQLDSVGPGGEQADEHPHGGLDQEHHQQQHPLG